MINDRIYDAIRSESGRIGTFGHGFTYGGHPVATAVALETLKIYEERDIVGHVRAISPAFQAGMRELGEHPLVGEARGMGLIATLELVRDRSTKAPFDPTLGVAAYAGKRAQSHGVITRALGDTINLCPPMIITAGQIEDLLSRIKLSLDDTLAWLSLKAN